MSAASRSPRRFFDPDPAAVLADYAEVVRRMRRDLASGRLSFADANETITAARILAVRLIYTDPVSLPLVPTDPFPPLPPSC